MAQRARVAVAASGGRDSTALLHCATRQARALGVEVVALHVHHGLQPQADAWLAQVRAQARRWGAGFVATRLDGGVPRGQSVEAWARRERYAALAEMARQAGCDLVLLAHHRRDQAETVLLQALRGGGAAGLAAMPLQIERNGMVWARPWLAQPREAIEAYLRRHRLAWVDDESNATPRHARNRLRLQVWPALLAAFPDVEGTLTEVARRAQDAAAIVAAVAQADLQAVLRVDDGLDAAGCLSLPPPRRREVLRCWLQQAVPTPVPETLVRRLADELSRDGAAGLVGTAGSARAAGLDASSGIPCLKANGRWPAGPGEVRLYRGALQWVPNPQPAASPPRPMTLDLSAVGRHRVPGWRGSWVVQPVRAGGIGIDRLGEAEMRARSGGEQFQAMPGGMPRSLKKQFQAAAVPSWARRAPLLFARDGALLCVPGLGIDARQMAKPGDLQCALRWEPEPAEAAQAASDSPGSAAGSA
jgi:tRNA(Ile)-lysidine synthase